ncbi:MAG: universal stress protein UspA [Actinobacteria bacterium 13_2_20CM_2_71_6]|nr:MAG: universal stress protein UspA [Actinobacteria bacterium 13_2_20CM_2_71_6]
MGFDGTASGEDALALGRWLARVSGVPAIVAVVHPSPAAIGTARVDAEWVADRHRLAEQILDGARQVLAGTGEPVEFRIVASSSAAHGLHDLVEDEDASVVVVGSRGTGPEEQLFAGSTADRLLSGSVCPVAVAPSGVRNRKLGELARVGVAFIDTPEAERALDVAGRFAWRTGAALRLYTVVPGEAEVMPLLIGADAERAFSAAAREAYQRALEAALAGFPPELDATGEVRTGDVVDTLAGLGPDEVDVLFCGSRGYGPARRVLLGGVSSRLVRRARSPVIVVPRAS